MRAVRECDREWVDVYVSTCVCVRERVCFRSCVGVCARPCLCASISVLVCVCVPAFVFSCVSHTH